MFLVDLLRACVGVHESTFDAGRALLAIHINS